MSCTVVSDSYSGGVEAWCDECGSVAYSTDYSHAWEIAAGAARLHDESYHGAIFLDTDGRPTLTPTSRYAGGCSNLLEESRALIAEREAAAASTPTRTV